MIWLTWRQFRTQAVVAAAALAALAVVAIVYALRLSHLYTGSGLAGCRADCGRLTQNFLDASKGSVDRTLLELAGAALYVIPVAVGLFWGAPLIAREVESGTHRLAWNQSVTRGRWLAAKLAGVGAATVMVVGLASLAVTRWASVYDGVTLDRMSPLVFGERGLVPVGYAAFALAVGVTAGLLLRRVVPAMAVTLVVVVAAMLVMPYVARAHLMSPVPVSAALDTTNIEQISIEGDSKMTVLGGVDSPGAWIVANETFTAAGRPFTGPVNTEACVFPSPIGDCINWLASLHLRQDAAYQPIGRFWALQWRETAIFGGLALLLCGFCFWWLHRRVT